MTLSELKKSVMDIVGEDADAPTYWTSSTDSEITRLLQDALEETCCLSAHTTQEFIIPLYEDRTHYRLTPPSGELLSLKSVRVMPEGYSLTLTDTSKLSRSDYTWMTRTGTPTSFYMIGHNVLRPVPYTSDSSHYLEVIASVIPAEPTRDSEEVNIDTNIANILIAYASYMLLLTLRRFDKSDYWFKKYVEFSNIGEVEGSKLVYRSIKLRSVVEVNYAPK